MAQASVLSVSDMVRDYVRKNYVKPALQRGEKSFLVNAGTIHKALSLRNRVPLVCEALKSRKFLEENNLQLISWTGPQSGQSTTVTFTYEIAATGIHDSSPNPLLALRGIARDVFKELGGGESFISSERNSFNEEREK